MISTIGPYAAVAALWNALTRLMLVVVVVMGINKVNRNFEKKKMMVPFHINMPSFLFLRVLA